MKEYILAGLLLLTLFTWRYWPVAEEIEYDHVTHVGNVESDPLRVDASGALSVTCATGCATIMVYDGMTWERYQDGQP